MAKKNIITRGVRAMKKVVRKGARTVQSVALDAKAIAAANMLQDPCNATISEGCYRGDQGYRSRFVTQSSYGSGAGQTALAVVFIPAANAIYFLAAANGSTSTAWVNNAGPGAPFLAANATAVRSLGACVSSTPVAANLATSGQVYTSIVPVSSLGVLSGSTTCDALSQLCNKYGKIQIDQPMETKFIPSGQDEDYASTTVIPTGDLNDINCILQVFLGMPAATGIICRFTNIIEWKPLPNIGIVSESFLGNPSKNTIEHVKNALLKRNPGWWSNVGNAAYSVLRGYATGGSVGAISAAMKSVKFM